MTRKRIEPKNASGHRNCLGFISYMHLYIFLKHESCYDACGTFLFFDECVDVARRFVDTDYGVDTEMLVTLFYDYPLQRHKKCSNSSIQLTN